MERSSLHRLMRRPLTPAPCVPSVASLMGVGPNFLLQTDAEAEPEPRNPAAGSWRCQIPLHPLGRGRGTKQSHQCENSRVLVLRLTRTALQEPKYPSALCRRAHQQECKSCSFENGFHQCWLFVKQRRAAQTRQRTALASADTHPETQQQQLRTSSITSS